MNEIALIVAIALGQTYDMKLVSCYDADTCRVDLIDTKKVGPETMVMTITLNQPIRLCDIDAPEIRGGDPATKEAAKRSRDVLLKWLATSRRLQVKIPMKRSCDPEREACGKKDKYGRWLAWLYADGVNLNDKLVEMGLAKAYHLKCK